VSQHELRGQLRKADDTELVAAFLTYVVHHKVFPEEPFASRFERAASLARTAPRLLVDSIRVEDALAKPKGWNAATWTLWGGQYGDAGRGSLHMDAWPVDSGMEEDAGFQTVDGGWAVQTGKRLVHSKIVTDI
jgi:hypothetical protein